MATITDLQRMVVQMELRDAQYQKRLRAAEQRTNRALSKIDARFGASGRAMQRGLGANNFKGFSSALAAVEGPLGGTASRIRSFNAVLRDVGPATAVAAVGLGALAIGASQVFSLADKFTRFENRLKTAGLEGENLAAVGDRLFEIANRNGVEIEALGSVYARASLAAKELGADQQKLDTFVGAVSDALRVQGSSAEASRGALLQLSQALGQDIVRGEEFNSILEGALPIAQAAARGITRFEGSVAKLRTAIINGEVTSKEFFEGVLRDAPNLATQAAKANLTLENSFTALYNQLARGVGQTDKALGASERLSQGIVYLANNLGTLGEAIGVITAAVGARLVSALGASAVAGGRSAISAVRGAIADRDAAKAALDRARAQTSAAVVARNDANAQFARAAAVRQATILEQQYQQTLLRRRAVAGLQSAFGALSGLVGGPLGIGLTALAGTYLIVSSRTEAAAERTRNLQQELRSLGYLAPEVAKEMEGAANAIEKLAADQLRQKIRETRDAISDLTVSGLTGTLSGIFGGDLALDQIEFFARQFRTNINPAIREAGEEIEEISAALRNGTITAEEFDRRIQDIAKRNPGESIDRLLGRLREIGPTIIASFPFLDRLENQLDRIGNKRFDASRQSAGRGGPSLAEISARQNFLADRTRAAALDEETRAVERRADAIAKEAEQAKVVISRTQALAQARRELAIESERSASSKLAQDMARAAVSDAQVISDLQRAIKTFGDERTQAMDRAAASLSDFATPEQVANVRALAAAMYDLGVAEAQREAADDGAAREEALRRLRDESRLIGLVGADLAEMEFIQERLNQKRAAGIPITAKVIEQVKQEAQAYRSGVAEILKHNEAQMNQIAVQDSVRQGIIDIGLAATRGSEDFGDAVGNMLRRIADLIIELYVLKPLVESIFGSMGSSGGGSVGGLIGGLLGFAKGGVMTSTGPRALPRYARGGISNKAAIFGEAGPEAAVPLPDGRRIPVDLRIPQVPASMSKSGGQTVVNVSVDARGASDPAAVEMAVQRGMKEVLAQVPQISVRSVVAAKAAGGSAGRALR